MYGSRIGAALSLLGVAACQSARTTAATFPLVERNQAATATAGPAYAFTNGRWFIDGRFDLRTYYSVNGILQTTSPARVDSMVDLAGGFAIPPFGDAHTHNLDGDFNLDAVVGKYVKEGTFYVQVLTNSQSGAHQVRWKFNHPCALDVAYANGGLTSTLSHPFQAYEPRAAGFYDYTKWKENWPIISKSRKLENDAYWFLDSLADVSAKWPRILAGGPDLIKIFLLNAMETPPRLPPDSVDFAGHGLRPSLIPEIVRRAHATGLRVAAHVETAADFELAVRSGVDILAHLPGYELGASESAADKELTEADAGLAARRGIVVIPTASLSLLGAAGPDSAETKHRREALQRKNISLLMRHGVRVAVGSDRYGQTAHAEFDALRALGLWDNRGLLTMWSEITPRSIFPRRRIGRLEPGYEASFLVLERDPLQDVDAINDIRLRVKQGCIMGS
jgi:hypothetical protein